MFINQLDKKRMIIKNYIKQIDYFNLSLILLSISLGLYQITIGESHPDFNSLHWLIDIRFFDLLAKLHGEIFG